MLAACMQDVSSSSSSSSDSSDDENEKLARKARKKILFLTRQLETTHDAATKSALQVKLLKYISFAAKKEAASTSSANPSHASTMQAQQRQPTALAAATANFQFKHKVTPTSGIFGKEKVAALTAEEKARRLLRQNRFVDTSGDNDSGEKVCHMPMLHAHGMLQMCCHAECMHWS